MLRLTSETAWSIVNSDIHAANPTI
jgi:hypothetical protein